MKKDPSSALGGGGVFALFHERDLLILSRNVPLYEPEEVFGDSLPPVDDLAQVIAVLP